MKEKISSPQEALRYVAKNMDVPESLIVGRSRVQEVADARHVYAYLLRRGLGYQLTTVGRIMDRDHSTVHHSVRSVERKNLPPPVLDVARQGASLCLVTTPYGTFKRIQNPVLRRLYAIKRAYNEYKTTVKWK